MFAISVVIPTRDRPQHLRKCLESFAAAHPPKEAWELIVVDDGGTDSFDGLPDELLGRLPIRLIQQINTGPAGARNHGARLAKGSILAFTDDDCQIEADWLRQIETAFSECACDCIGGTVLNLHPQNTAAAAWSAYLEALYERYTDLKGNVVMLTSNNIAYRREVFDLLGGFDEVFRLAASEDVELGQRLVASGYCQRLEPGIRLWHDHPSSARNYLRQQFRYGRGGYHLKRIITRQDYSTKIAWRKQRKGEFFWKIAKRLWAEGAPIGVWVLIGLTPLAHRLGQWAAAIRGADS